MALMTTDRATILPENPPPSTSIYVLANEILIEIFKKGAEAWALSKNAQSTVPFPILVSEVCSHWRAVALDAPELWKTVYLPLHLEIPSTWDPYTWVSTWIQRAKTIPITVVLDIPGDPPHIEEICLSQVIPLIVKASPVVSVRRLDIRYHQEGISREVILQTFQEFFDSPHRLTFEQLSLCFSGTSFRNAVMLTGSTCPWGHTVMDQMPVFRVSKLRLRGIIINPLQFPNLTSLTIFDLLANHKDIEALFATSPNLTHLTLRDFRMAPQSSLTIGNTVCLQSLQTLAIRFDTTSPNSAYPLSYLHLPNLKYLELDGNLTLSVSQVLCESPSADQLEILVLSNFKHSFRSPSPTASYTLHSVKHIRLINVRLSECMSPSPTSMSIQTSLLDWPAFQTLAMNATLARDVIDLLNFPHPHIRTVYLTPAAQHHLTHNTGRNGHHLTRNTGRNEGNDTFYLKFPLISARDIRCPDVKKRDEANIAAASYNKRFNVKDFDPMIHSCLLEDPEEPGFLSEII